MDGRSAIASVHGFCISSFSDERLFPDFLLFFLLNIFLSVRYTSLTFLSFPVHFPSFLPMDFQCYSVGCDSDMTSQNGL